MPGLLQISDPHFGTERPAVVDALVALAHALAPELVVLSGDITQRARRAQFGAARAFVERLPTAPRVVVPGNHDLPLFNPFARWLWPYAHHRRVFGPALEPVHDAPGWLVIGVDSTRRFRHKHGQLSGAQIERVAGRLRAAEPGQWRIVVLHHPLVAFGPDRVNRVRCAAQALQAWSAAGADVVLGGHIHLPYVRRAGEGRGPWIVQAGTALSTRVRHEAGNSVNLLLRAGPGRALPVVERWDFDEAHGRFERAAVNELPPQRSHALV